MATHILLIEDDDELRAEICEFLSRRQNVVRDCRTIAEARNALGERRPNIVIADIHLPDGDSTSFCLAHAAQYPRTRWLLMSGDSDRVRQTRQLRRAPDAPPFSVLDKPVSMRMLDDFVRLAVLQDSL